MIYQVPSPRDNNKKQDSSLPSWGLPSRGRYRDSTRQKMQIIIPGFNEYHGENKPSDEVTVTGHGHHVRADGKAFSGR